MFVGKRPSYLRLVKIDVEAKWLDNIAKRKNKKPCLSNYPFPFIKEVYQKCVKCKQRLECYIKTIGHYNENNYNATTGEYSILSDD
jgi:hypothetical protein